MIPPENEANRKQLALTRLYDDQEGVARVYAAVEDWLYACDCAFAVNDCRQEKRHLRRWTSGP